MTCKNKDANGNACYDCESGGGMPCGTTPNIPQEERGEAGIIVTLKDSEIQVHHIEDGTLLFSRKACLGDWNRIWDAIEKA